MIGPILAAIGLLRTTTKTIVNYCSSGGVQVGFGASLAGSYRLKGYQPGSALTANALNEVLYVPGAGELNVCAVQLATAGGSRTIRLRVIVDGNTAEPAFDAVSNTVTVQYAGLFAAGAFSTASPWLCVPERVQFRSSLSVQIASSINESAAGNIVAGISHKIYG